ncbi:hypothetical protein WJX77_001828 [Trebouxia sp. C0004]
MNAARPGGHEQSERTAGRPPSFLLVTGAATQGLAGCQWLQWHNSLIPLSISEALHENLPATFNALERTAIKRILKHPDAAGTRLCKGTILRNFGR